VKGNKVKVKQSLHLELEENCLPLLQWSET